MTSFTRLIQQTPSAAISFVEFKLQKYQIVLFSKSYSPEGKICDEIIRDCHGIDDNNYDCVTYEKRSDCSQVDDYLWTITGTDDRTIPVVFVRGDFLGGYKELLDQNRSGQFQRIINNLPNFPPGSKNYRRRDRAYNLVLQADPDLVPATFIRLIGDESASTIVKFAAVEMESHVDCNHIFTTSYRKSKGPVDLIIPDKTSSQARPIPSEVVRSNRGLLEPSSKSLMCIQASRNADMGSLIDSIKLKSRTHGTRAALQPVPSIHPPVAEDDKPTVHNTSTALLLEGKSMLSMSESELERSSIAQSYSQSRQSMPSILE